MTVHEFNKRYPDKVMSNSTIIFNRLQIAIDKALDSGSASPYLTYSEVHHLIANLTQVCKVLDNQLKVVAYKEK